MKKKKTSLALRLVLGLIFLSAATYRIFYYPAAVTEMAVLHLPSFVAIPVIAFELAVAVLFFTGYQLRIAMLSSVIFVAAALVLAVVEYGGSLFSRFGQVFTFSPDPVDFTLHLLFLFLLLLLYHETD